MLHAAFKRRAMREWYGWLAENTADRTDWTLMNYGYPWSEADGPPPPGPLPEAIAERLAAQLYWKVAMQGGPLTGKDVLEVGSGRGGGAAFLVPRIHATRYVGSELVPAAVELATRAHAQPGLEFVVADAERLPFEGGSFDAVINVESSHAYGSSARFFAEVARVLRPGGALLFCDFRPRELLGTLHHEITAPGLVVEEGQDITAQVIAALEARAAALEPMMADLPRDKVEAMRAFCVMPGTAPFTALADRSTIYVCCRARRP